MDDRQLGRPRLHLDGGEAARPEQPHLPHLPTALKTNWAPQDKVPRPPPPLRHAIASSERQPEDSPRDAGTRQHLRDDGYLFPRAAVHAGNSSQRYRKRPILASCSTVAVGRLGEDARSTSIPCHLRAFGELAD